MSEQNLKKTSNLNAKLVVLVTLLIALIVLIPIGYALFSDYDKENGQSQIGRIDVELKEDWPDPEPGGDEDEFGLNRSTKKIWGHSVGNLPAYVRVRIIPTVEYNTDKANGQGDWYTAPIPQENIVLSIDTKDENNVSKWTQSGEYWYYNDILPAGEDTSELSISWAVDEMPSEFAEYKVRVNVKVILEYAQTTNDMWKEIFQINELPM